MSADEADPTSRVDTMAPYLQTPQWRPRIVTGFGPRLIFIDEAGQQVALRLTEAQLWALGQEIAEALLHLRSWDTIRSA